MTDHHAAGFRIRPRVWIGVVIWLAYGLLVYSVQLASGIPYTTWDENGANLFLGGGISLVVATPLLAITTTKLGWWRPALFDAGRSRHRWPITAPIFMAGLLLLNLVATDWAAYDGPFLAASIVLLLVGFTEEMTLRGLLLVALRSKFAEVWVWLISTLAFALMHFGIVILGQGIAETNCTGGLRFHRRNSFLYCSTHHRNPGLGHASARFLGFFGLCRQPRERRAGRGTRPGVAPGSRPVRADRGLVHVQVGATQTDARFVSRIRRYNPIAGEGGPESTPVVEGIGHERAGRAEPRLKAARL